MSIDGASIRSVQVCGVRMLPAHMDETGNAGSEYSISNINFEIMRDRELVGTGNQIYKQDTFS